MSDLKNPDQAVFFLSCLYEINSWSEEELLIYIKESFKENYPTYFESFTTYKNTFFPMKDYYSKEMGPDLSRLFIFSTSLNDLTSLVSLKIKCDSLERQNLNKEARTFNLDPGYISSSQMVLATGKPYSHRIYLDQGVYGELCYQYEAKSFKKLPWSYPDYGHDEIIQAFNIIREINFFKKNL